MYNKVLIIILRHLLSPDIDECQNTHGCSGICVNQPGSYECRCSSGFKLKFDGTNCEGMLMATETVFCHGLK